MTSAKHRTRKRQRRTQRSKTQRQNLLSPELTDDLWSHYTQASKPTPLFAHENSLVEWAPQIEITETQDTELKDLEW